jgi:hypothetical protein
LKPGGGVTKPALQFAAANADADDICCCVLLLLLLGGCESPERRFLDRRGRENAREREMIDFRRKQYDAAFDLSGLPSNGPGPYQSGR